MGLWQGALGDVLVAEVEDAQNAHAKVERQLKWMHETVALVVFQSETWDLIGMGCFGISSAKQSDRYSV